MAVPFDPRRLEVTGAPVQIMDGILQSVYNGDSQYSISATGSLVYVPGSAQIAQRKLVWVDRKGAEQAVAAPFRVYRYPRLSPDGRRVALTIEEPDTQIWIYEPARETLARLTFEGNDNLLGLGRPMGSVCFLGQSS